MSEGVAYQNKDILFKVLAQTYKEKALRHMESISRQSGNCFQQTFLKFQQTKKILTICFCWKMELMPLLIMKLNLKN